MSAAACAWVFSSASRACSRAASAARMLPLLRFQSGSGKLTPRPMVLGMSGGSCSYSANKVGSGIGFLEAEVGFGFSQHGLGGEYVGPPTPGAVYFWRGQRR